MENLSPQEKRKREVTINLFNSRYNSYGNIPIEEAQFNTKQTKKLFIDYIIDRVKAAHIDGYGDPHENCALMAYSAFLEAAYRTNESVTYIQVYKRDNPNEKTISAIAIGDFPTGEFYVVSPWLGAEEESIWNSTRFRANMNSREDRTYSIVIKVGKPSEDNFREEVRTALREKQYESWINLPKRNSYLHEVKRNAKLFSHNLLRAHEDFIPTNPTPPPPSSSPPIPDSSSPPPYPHRQECSLVMSVNCCKYRMT